MFLRLSGGAYLGYYHMGVVKALYQEGLLPRVISGASAGSIITAIIGTRNDLELMDLINTREGYNPLDHIRTDFFRYSDELRSEIARRLNYLVPQGLRWITFPIFSSIFDKKLLNLDTEHFKKAMMQNVGLYTFQEAFDRTGRIINITVAPLNRYDPPRLLNYLTAPHVCVWSAAAASCALPGIFDSVPLIVKEPNGQFRPENEWTRQALIDQEEAKAAKLASYSDGSLENDLPMQQLSELFNVNHFVVSQANPHSAILSSLSMKATGDPARPLPLESSSFILSPATNSLLFVRLLSSLCPADSLVASLVRRDRRIFALPHRAMPRLAEELSELLDLSQSSAGLEHSSRRGADADAGIRRTRRGRHDHAVEWSHLGLHRADVGD